MGFVWLVLAATLTSSTTATKDACSAPIVAAADSVAAAFDAHQFVFIGSTHGGKKSHDFLLCLLARPSFHRRVTDVLVEWANPVHQALVDRYLIKLDPIPVESLRPVWVDTDAPQLWGRLPLIPEFYEAVRSINSKLDPARRIRVLGGCEPIDWARVRTADDVATYPYKTNWAAHVITEHFAPDSGRRVLVVYGDGHIHHNGGNIMSHLYKLDRATLFVVGTIDDAVTTDDVGKVARIGNATRPFYISGARLPATPPYPRRLFYVRDKPLAEYVDAIVYFGPEPDPDLSKQTELTEREKAEIIRRDAIKGDPRELLQLRLGKRDRWFRSHPNDLAPDPRL